MMSHLDDSKVHSIAELVDHEVPVHLDPNNAARNWQKNEIARIRAPATENRPTNHKPFKPWGTAVTSFLLVCRRACIPPFFRPS
jgi:hypothetical protein